MKTLIGGAVVAALGLIGLSMWFGYFLQLLTGAIPVMLLLGGGLAIYLGFDEMKDAREKDDSSFGADSSTEDDEMKDARKKDDSSFGADSSTEDDEMKDARKKDDSSFGADSSTEDTENDNKEIEDLKKETDSLKSEKS